MTYKSTNPFTNETFKTYENSSPEQVESALVTVAKFAPTLAQMAFARRSEILHRIAKLFKQEQQPMAQMMTTEMGKLITESLAEVELCINILDYFADHGEEFMAPVTLDSSFGKAYYLKQAIGPILMCEPWNFPLYQIIRVFAPNYMAGNPMILKHASNVPGSARMAADIIKRGGAPEGSLINLFVSYDQVEEIIADPRIKAVALTGSERGGRAVARAAGEHLKKSTMELGGNDAFIILDDADKTELQKIVANARLSNAGQVCTSSKRFIVLDSYFDEFIELLTKEFKAVKMGNPLDPKTTLAPLSSAAAKEKIQVQVDRAVANGAKIIYGNEPVDLPGQFFMPTILSDITPDNPIFDEELFGPVAQVYRVHSEQEAIALANNSSYGLGSTVFSANPARAEAVAAQIEAGMTFINSAWTSLPELPFGGIKNSGYGRELSELGQLAFVNEHLITNHLDH
ncbi:succinate-semialdehyde dehydrogenase (NADP+) [Amylolactobacillus amylotrophicus DSM 20534]|uniref:Succinate-semialdehyde dehydrogenase (NADP+) n=3 Tax=Amylolactobacillus TaxID=2767876 RepID=A0A0R1YLI7_9LACO|nr:MULTISPECIES: NAD-dependent succinate-semialdehyde dehydrogenase [Amylolactobacillus]APT18817.1 succinate-semialdehyde dehydrogenase [Amylolactobacillus amylophilus DSM 20533 = JCM 1125]KRK37137.1 succinate-semialdehyde dehydrogenase (NADP+) [Amylolactobacillus amylotrophicus DSM 20534]KRM43454.1 succinate-semialdehyde dehydrogenase (NADP+) [Amylolactobacillus amylophilus DSM 20533 = JCM 1125]GED80831.1 succinate-semialdehyde dehydrogenase [Amylolactobacillus amylophilus]